MKVMPMAAGGPRSFLGVTDLPLTIHDIVRDDWREDALGSASNAKGVRAEVEIPCRTALD